MAGLFEFFGGYLTDTLPVSVRHWNAGARLFPYGGTAFKVKHGV
jgi:hypothetical protein